jgi:integrase
VHIEPFSLHEVNRIVSSIRADWRDYVLVRFFTGMRTGEVDGLKWQYVDFERRQILVRETFSGGVWEYTKNDGSQRAIDMSMREKVFADLPAYFHFTKIPNSQIMFSQLS